MSKQNRGKKRKSRKTVATATKKMLDRMDAHALGVKPPKVRKRAS